MQGGQREMAPNPIDLAPVISHDLLHGGMKTHTERAVNVRKFYNRNLGVFVAADPVVIFVHGLDIDDGIGRGCRSCGIGRVSGGRVVVSRYIAGVLSWQLAA